MKKLLAFAIIYRHFGDRNLSEFTSAEKSLICTFLRSAPPGKKLSSGAFGYIWNRDMTVALKTDMTPDDIDDFKDVTGMCPREVKGWLGSMGMVDTSSNKSIFSIHSQLEYLWENKLAD